MSNANALVSRPRTTHSYRLLLGIAALWIAFIALAGLLAFHTRFGMLDFGAYYQGALRIVRGEALYRGFVGNTYIYPPLLAQLLIPLTSLTQEAAAELWFGFSLIVLIAVTVMLDRLSKRRGFWWIIIPLFFPVLETLQVGQVTILLLALLMGAWYAVKTDRRFLGGGLLALAAWIKVYPALVILYFAWKRDWRIVFGGLIVGAALAGAQIAVSGIDKFLSMFPILFSLTNYGEFNLFAKNASINGFATQLFGSLPLVQPLLTSPLLALIVRGLLSLALVIGTAWLTAGSSQNKRRFDLEYALVITTALLLSPTLYASGMPPLLLVFFLLLRTHPTKRMIWFVVSACLVLSIYWLFVTGYSGNPPQSGLLVSFGFYTVLMTWSVNAILLRRQHMIAVSGLEKPPIFQEGQMIQP